MHHVRPPTRAARPCRWFLLCLYLAVKRSKTCKGNKLEHFQRHIRLDGIAQEHAISTAARMPKYSRKSRRRLLLQPSAPVPLFGPLRRSICLRWHRLTERAGGEGRAQFDGPRERQFLPSGVEHAGAEGVAHAHGILDVAAWQFQAVRFHVCAVPVQPEAAFQRVDGRQVDAPNSLSKKKRVCLSLYRVASEQNGRL